MTIVRVVARLRIVLLAVAVLTLARVAYAQNINIEIQGDPWKASPLEARKQYLRGREADEMIRKGYSCFRLPSGACDWEKLSSFRLVSTPTARWGKCVKSTAPVKGRMCERKSSPISGSYYDFERPLVLLVEEIHDARELAKSDNPLFGGDATTYLRGLQAAFLKKAQDIYKRLTAEQTTVLDDRFGDSLDEVFVELVPVERVEESDGRFLVSHFQKGKVDPNRWTAAHSKKAAEAAKAKSVDSEAKPAPKDPVEAPPPNDGRYETWIPSRGVTPSGSAPDAVPVLVEKPAPTFDAKPVEATAPDESADDKEPVADKKSAADKELERRNLGR